MAQILEDGPKNCVLKFLGAETFALSQLSGGPKSAVVKELWYDVGAVTDAQLQWDTTISLTVPVLTSVTTSTTGGTFAAGTYFYVVTAIFPQGESTKSNELSVVTTGTTSSNTVNWGAVAGATGYRVYRGTTTGGQNTYFVVGAVTTFLDTGAAGTAGTPPTATVVNGIVFTLSGRDDKSFENVGGLYANITAGTITSQSLKVVGTGTFTLVVRIKKSY